jgi:hypothetical protein
MDSSPLYRTASFLLVLFACSCGEKENPTGSAAIPSGPAYEGVLAIDELAAHPKDPDRVVKGVAMDDIIPRKAIDAGEEAVKKHPGTPRFHYQLGRAYDAGGQKEKAFTCYQTAAAMGHRMADYNLGLAYAKGEGVKQDLDKAKKHFEKAVTSGVKTAESDLAYYVFNPEGFSNPEYFEAIYRGEVEKLKVNQTELATQLFNFIAPFFKTDDCRQPISMVAAQRLGEHAAMSNLGELLGGMVRSRRENPTSTGSRIDYEGAARAGYQEGKDFTLKMSAQADVAQRDAQLFYDRHGCDSPVAKQFFANIEKYANNLGNASFWGEVEKRAYGR